MDKFPEDFNSATLQNKMINDNKKCLAKYRKKIYDQFKCAESNSIRIEIDNDYTKYIHYMLILELRQRKLSVKIITQENVYIIGGENNENDPEIKTFTDRYILIKAIEMVS